MSDQGGLGKSVWESDPELFEQAYREAVKQAVAAERERCANIADEQSFDDHALEQATDYGRGAHQAATDIAAAIRKGEA
jgi:hypothetical protein